MIDKIKKNIFIIVVIFLIILGLYCFIKIEKSQEVIEEMVVDEELVYIPVEEMNVTMLGGSNMKDQGNMNSCGYIVRSKNGELIIVDGGRDIDCNLVLKYIKKYGDGVVDHWYVTHPHSDHVGALLAILENENVRIKNIYYSFNELEWYKENDKSDYEFEERIINAIKNTKKIDNKVQCEKNQIIQMDNIDCEIIRIANPEITKSDNGNDSSMVFKMTEKNNSKSIIFLGDAFTYTSIELMKNPEKLKANAVQMAHHGQNGVTKEVYEAIKPEICFFNAPEWLYNNDNGKGYNSGEWQSVIVREWVKELGAQSLIAFEADVTVIFKSDGFEIKR